METPRVKCDSCAKDYKTKANLNKHVATKHKAIIELDEDFPEDTDLTEAVEEIELVESTEEVEMVLQEFFPYPTTMEPIPKEAFTLEALEEPITSVCMVCHQEFPGVNELNLHITNHHPPTLTCTMCPFTTIQQPSMQQHMVLDHPTPTVPAPL